MRLSTVQPIDPLTAAPCGGYADELVEVRRIGPRPAGPPTTTLRPITRTAHFALFQHGERLLIEQCLAPSELDEDLATMLRLELFDAGWVSGTELFERIFTGVVVSSADRPLDAWELFYRNTLNRIEPSLGGAGSCGVGHDPLSGAGTVSSLPFKPSRAYGSSLSSDGVIAEHVPLYARALELTRGRTALELGCCFGFLSLLLAGRGFQVAAVDIVPGTAQLLAQMAARLQLRVQTLACDAARVSRGDGAVDTVLVIHLLEHLVADHAAGVLAEALRLARQRVVVAVPFEAVAEPLFGHVQTLQVEDLVGWGRRSRHPFRVEEFHGGWLVIDRR